ncbi:MAG TPA: hypothetical protein DCX95_05970 [Elusimicrobia bacterium]|nr:hypothetical protein [Elusimicrobiota bacterium]
MFIKFLKKLIGLIVLLIMAVSIFIHIKLPSYTKTIESEIAELNKQLSMLSNQKKYETLIKQSVYSDAEILKTDLLPPIEEEKKSLVEQNKNLLKENRLLSGHLNILSTKVIFDTKSNRLKLVKNGKVSSDIAVSKKFVTAFSKSEINRKTLKILAKEKNPAPIKPKWMYEDITKEIPAENTAERIMVGALGNYAVYFTDYLIVHDFTKNIQQHDTINHVCIQLNLKDMKKLYNSVFIGNKLYVE